MLTPHMFHQIVFSCRSLKAVVRTSKDFAFESLFDVSVGIVVPTKISSQGKSPAAAFTFVWSCVGLLMATK